MLLVQLLSLTSLYLAYKGSKLFVESNFELGSKLFMLGNITNMAIALNLGNLYLFIAQSMLCYFTLNMISVNTKRFYTLMFVLLLTLILILGINNNIHFIYHDLIDIFGTITAVYGAYSMSKQRYTTMARMWILADLAFIIVAIKLGLIGLFIQSVIFCYHGYLRLKK